MNYIDYIKKHKEDINATCRKVNYKDVYKKSFDDVKNGVFKKVLAEFKKKGELGRADIFKEVEEGNLYKAFFMIILWGGIRENNLKSVIAYIESKGEDFVKENLLEIFKLVNDNKVSDSFSRLKKGAYHIDGVGVSFFTKLLYFFDTTNLGERALIFDRWSKKEHCAILMSNDNIDYKQFYTLTKFGNKIDVYCNADESELYLDYIQRMKKISSEINQPDIGKVEEFLFGEQRSKSALNPRRILDDILSPYCNDDKWSAFKPFYSLANTSKHQNDSFVKGYCIPLYSIKTENAASCQFRICVIDENESGTFYCILMYKWQGQEWGEKVDRWTDYPDAINIFNVFSKTNKWFNHYSEGKWLNRNSAKIKSYKYVNFKNNENAALNFMEDVVRYVKVL